MGIGQLCGFRGNSDIAEQCDVGRETQRVAIDSGHDRLFDIEQVLDHPPSISHHDTSPAAALALGGLVMTGEVTADGKRFARTCQQDRIDVAILRQVQPDLLELVVQGRVHGVEVCGPVEGHRGHPLGDLDLQKLVRAVVYHGFAPSFAQCTTHSGRGETAGSQSAPTRAP